MEKTGNQLYQDTKLRLLNTKLIKTEYIYTSTVFYHKKQNNTNLQKVTIETIDLTPYFDNYLKLLSQVPTTVSDSSYVLRHIFGIKDLVKQLRSLVYGINEEYLQYITNLRILAQNEQKEQREQKNLNTQNDLNLSNFKVLHCQLLSKQFNKQNPDMVKMIRYIYFQVFQQWYKINVSKKIIFQKYLYPIKNDEGFLCHNVRMNGDMIYDALAVTEHVLQKANTYL